MPTKAPAACKRRAVSRPSPWLAPVTIAHFWLRSIGIMMYQFDRFHVERVNFGHTSKTLRPRSLRQVLFPLTTSRMIKELPVRDNHTRAQTGPLD